MTRPTPESLTKAREIIEWNTATPLEIRIAVALDASRIAGLREAYIEGHDAGYQSGLDVHWGRDRKSAEDAWLTSRAIAALSSGTATEEGKK